MKGTIYVFFCRTPKTSRWWNRLWGWLVRPFHMYPAEHLVIGHDGLVVDPLYSGNHLWQLHGFVRRYPIHSCIAVTPTPFRISLRAFDCEKQQKNRLFPVLYWLTGLARFQTDDCLGVAIQCLQAAGLKLPKRFRTIGGLYRWLRNEGYACQKFSAPDRWVGTAIERPDRPA